MIRDAHNVLCMLLRVTDPYAVKSFSVCSPMGDSCGSVPDQDVENSYVERRMLGSRTENSQCWDGRSTEDLLGKFPKTG